MIANGTSITVIAGTMVSGIAAKKENGTNTVSITVTMVTGKTATTIVMATKTAIKFYGRSSEPGKGSLGTTTGPKRRL